MAAHWIIHSLQSDYTRKRSIGAHLCSAGGPPHITYVVLLLQMNKTPTIQLNRPAFHTLYQQVHSVRAYPSGLPSPPRKTKLKSLRLYSRQQTAAAAASI